MSSGFRWRHLAVFVLPAVPPAAFAWLGAGSALAAWLPLALVHLLVPIADAIAGEDGDAPAGPTPAANRALPLACLPAWFGLLAWAAALAPSLGPLAWAGLAASLGAIGGIVAINAAHELIHRASRAERAAGALLLAGVCYGAFRIEHVRGHHLRVATPEDPATARRGESVYAFVPRSIRGTLASAWRLEAARLQRDGRSPWHWRNEWLALNALSVAIAASLWWAFGASAVLLFVAASLGAILELEVINYVEHYGLLRERGADGRYRPVTAADSWNVDTAVVNAFLFNLQRHSDHHLHGGRDHLQLESLAHAPRLPAGYGAMVLLALVPPLWRRVMHPRLAALGRA